MVNERRRGSGPVFVSGATKAASLLSGGRPREPEKSSYTRRKPCGLVFGQEFDSPRLHHVGASFISLAPTFLQKSERAHSAAPPFQPRIALLDSQLVLGANLNASTSKVFTLSSSSQALYRLRRIFYASHEKRIQRTSCCSSLPNRIHFS